MSEIINAIWELRTIFVFLVGVTAGLVIATILVAARKNEEEDGPPTILILPPDEAHQAEVRRQP